MAKKEETTVDAVPTTNNASQSKDAGKNFFVQLGSALGGLAGGYVIAEKASGGNKLWGALGALGGAVIMHKIAPELATDIQRANEYVDSQKAAGKSEGKLSDRFKAIITNVKVKGQDLTADSDVDITSL